MRKPKNLIIQWEPPRVEVRKKITYLGIVRANPEDYAKKFGNKMITAHNIPDEIRHVPNPNGLVLAADVQQEAGDNVPELYGDVNALIDVDLDREGLGEYRSQIHALNASHVREYLSPSSSSSADKQNQAVAVMSKSSCNGDDSSQLLSSPFSPPQTHRIIMSH